MRKIFFLILLINFVLIKSGLLIIIVLMNINQEEPLSSNMHNGPDYRFLSNKSSSGVLWQILKQYGQFEVFVV